MSKWTRFVFLVTLCSIFAVHAPGQVRCPLDQNSLVNVPCYQFDIGPGYLECVGEATCLTTETCIPVRPVLEANVYAYTDCIDFLEVATDYVADGIIGEASTYDIWFGFLKNHSAGAIGCDGFEYFESNTQPC
jgi:hypothetical protein